MMPRVLCAVFVMSWCWLGSVDVVRGDEEVIVVSREQVGRAYAVFFDSGESKGKARPARFEYLKGDRWKITVPVTEAEASAGVLFTAFAETLSGRVLSGVVRRAGQSFSSQVPLSCVKDATIYDHVTIGAFTPDERKVFRQVKSERIQKLQERLNQLLTPATFDLLNQREKQLGLSGPKSITIDTPLADLVRRIVRIQAIE